MSCAEPDPGRREVGGYRRSAVPSRLWSGVYMETIQVVLDSKLLRAADRAARDARMNRSALIRQALRQHLTNIRIQQLEELTPSRNAAKTYSAQAQKQ